MEDSKKKNLAKQFISSTIHNMESKMVNSLINDYWDYMIKEIQNRKLIDDTGIDELVKSDLLNRFLIENSALINNTKIESSKMRQ